MYKFINGKVVYEKSEVDAKVDPLITGIETAIAKADAVSDQATAAVNTANAASAAVTALETRVTTAEGNINTMNSSITSASSVATSAYNKAETAIDTAISMGLLLYPNHDALPTTTAATVPGYAITTDSGVLYNSVIDNTEVTWVPIGKLINA